MPKRPRNPTGFVRKHPDTASLRWQGVVKYWDSEEERWRPRSKTFGRKAEAQAWVDEALREHRQHPNYRPPSEETLGEYLDRWLDDAVQGRHRASTVDRYRLAAKQITRHIGSISLSRLSPRDVQHLDSVLLADGLAPATVRLTHTVLHAACEQAVEWSLLPRNPAHRVRPPSPVRREPTVPTLAEARAFLQAAESDRLQPLWITLALTGMRRGEALALRWTDIHWDTQTVVVQRTLSRYAAKRTVEDTKTRRGGRTIALSPYLETVLRDHQAHQAILREAAGDRWQDGGWVFTTRHGTWIAPSHFYAYFTALRDRAGLPARIRPHDLRHALATHWLASGIPVKVVTERLGHSSVAITLELYAHVLPNMQAAAAAQMEAALLGHGVTTASPRAQRSQASGEIGATTSGL